MAPGASIHDLDTPALVCDLDVLERNILDMAARCRQLDIALRAHVKTHKIPAIAEMQRHAGASGLCCQKLGEAEVMVEAGFDDILIPFNIIGFRKLQRLVRLAARATLTVCVDSETTAQGIAAAVAAAGVRVRLLVELDTGFGRCGVQTPAAAVGLAERVAALPGLELAGVLLMPSDTAAKPFLDETLGGLRNAGLPPRVVSGGGTGRESASKRLGCTETRSGSYVWEGGARVRSREQLDPRCCATRLITTVVSTPTDGRAIIDAGEKAFASYPPLPFGLCIEDPSILLRGMSFEHGILDVADSRARPRVGDRLSFIPTQQEVTVNLHDRMYAVRGERVEHTWAIQARGCSS